MKYKKIEDYIIKCIESGVYKIGELIESEEELCKKFKMSHLTVNKALTNLANAGYLKRVRGKGTYVDTKPATDDFKSRRFFSFTEEIEKSGRKPSSVLLEYRVMTGKEVPDVASCMRISENERLHYFVRIRKADDVPVAIMYCYLTVKEVPFIDISVLENGSLWQFLAERGFGGTKKSYYKLSAVMPTKEQAKYLDISENIPVLLSNHVSTTKDNEIYYYVDSYYISDRYDYTYISETIHEKGVTKITE